MYLYFKIKVMILGFNSGDKWDVLQASIVMPGLRQISQRILYPSPSWYWTVQFWLQSVLEQSVFKDGYPTPYRKARHMLSVLYTLFQKEESRFPTKFRILVCRIWTFPNIAARCAPKSGLHSARERFPRRVVKHQGRKHFVSTTIRLALFYPLHILPVNVFITPIV